MWGTSLVVVLCTMLFVPSPLCPQQNLQTQPSFLFPSHPQKEKQTLRRHKPSCDTEWTESRNQTMKTERKVSAFSNSYLPFRTELVFLGLWWNRETHKKISLVKTSRCQVYPAQLMLMVKWADGAGLCLSVTTITRISWLLLPDMSSVSSFYVEGR